MNACRSFAKVGSFAAVFVLSSRVFATTEPPSPHDARGVAMGSTGVASTHNAAAMFHNVAGLHEVETFTATISASPTKLDQTSPLNGPDSAVDSDSSWVPLFLVGAAYRVHERIVVGLAAYATGGFGSEYNVPIGAYKVTLGALEFSPGVSIGITENLSLGLGYRISYLMQEGGFRLPADPTNPASPIVDSTLDLSGTNFTGAHVGLYYRPIKTLKLGLAYRSKVTTELEGKMKALGQEFDAKSDFSFPHGFKIGAAYEVIPDTLTLALDIRYLLHAEANKKSVIEVPPQPPMVEDLDWKNSINVGIGAEYNVTPMVPVRAGYALTTSATPDDKPGPFFVPPGVLNSVHLGAGLNFEKFDVDVGGYHTWGGSDADKAAALPGRYELKNYVLALSLTYHTG
jgi:long-chain fatty acid transport protein